MAAADADRWLIVGLGNPGSRYEGNRHNVGFMVVDELARRASLSWRGSARFRGELALGEVARSSVVLLKPQTYMNLSGESGGATARYYRIPVERVIVVHDDVDLDPGRLKIKRGGGDGGHNGVRSLVQHLAGPDFIRIRFGVGRAAVGDVTDHVLRDFSRDERELVEASVTRAANAVKTVLSRGLTEAMNRHNRPPKKPSPADPPPEGSAPG